ncbi:MAG: polyprenyl synthetase family protein [Candidatus Omnitrophota bacterium]|nr:polyprenyl synthetase family protein [Candidatus Omnitrophota bacterium]
MLKKLKKDINRELRAFLKDPGIVPGKNPIFGLLYSGIRDFVQRGGKRIRPLLMLISYQGYSKRRHPDYKKLIRSSLSLELLHDFFLIHDDVIDRSDLRRGKPTLHRVFNSRLSRKAKDEIGPNLSIAAGDTLFAMAVSALLSSDEPPSRKEKALEEFVRAAASTGTGEFIDILGNIKKIENVTEKDVFLTYTLKTARYTFECPLLTGGILAGAQKKELKKLSALGLALGHAFQIQDDLLDIFSSSKETGKPVLSDLNESKKTLLVWKTYTSLRGKDKKLLKHLLEKKKKTYSDLLRFRKLIKETGAHEYCLKKTKSMLLEADATIGKLRMKKKYKAALKELVRSIFSKIG